MTTRLERSLDYATSPAALHAAFTDDAYWPARVAEVGGEGARVAELSITGEGAGRSVRVLVVHVIGEDKLPPVVTAIRPGGLEIHDRQLLSHVQQSGDHFQLAYAYQHGKRVQ